jgi:precorrin-2 dehydrogenase/sirohydrochlorin ferrochelatase
LAICGARVVVISRQLASDLGKMKREGRIDHVEADYEASYLNGALLVIGATDCPEVNEKIAADARALGIMVNIADDPERCDFILPAVSRKGELLISVSTGGKSPALAKKLRAELDASHGQEYAILLDIMGSVRNERLARGYPAAENKRIFTALINSPLLDYIRAGKLDEVQGCIREIAAIQGDTSGLTTLGKG